MREMLFSLLAIGMMATTVWAQDPPPPADVKRITMTTGFDVLTAYVFRGIHQESDGVVLQPPLDVGIALGKGVTANFGNWYSLHSGPSGSFYEADLYGSVTFSAGKLKPGVLYTAYSSPNARFRTVNEVAAILALDDSGSAFPLAPKATVAFELAGQADGGAKRGTYLELAMRPAIKLVDAKYVVNLAIPVRLGTSLKDYYESPQGNDRFGFFSSGLVASIPITTRSVTWDFHGGVDLLWLGENMKALNSDDGFKPVGIIGVTLVY